MLTKYDVDQRLREWGKWLRTMDDVGLGFPTATSFLKEFIKASICAHGPFSPMDIPQNLAAQETHRWVSDMKKTKEYKLPAEVLRVHYVEAGDVASKIRLIEKIMNSRGKKFQRRDYYAQLKVAQTFIDSRMRFFYEESA